MFIGILVLVLGGVIYGFFTVGGIGIEHTIRTTEKVGHPAPRARARRRARTKATAQP